jgi:hypothetical protein
LSDSSSSFLFLFLPLQHRGCLPPTLIWHLLFAGDWPSDRGAEWRGCLLMASLPTRFSVGVVSLSLWVKTLATRQRVLVLPPLPPLRPYRLLPPPEPLASLHLLWSASCILFPTYLPYLESIHPSTTCGRARWGTDNPTRALSDLCQSN